MQPLDDALRESRKQLGQPVIGLRGTVLHPGFDDGVAHFL
jgi:hypothetical protein